jgi:chromosome segregation ATPase
MAGFIGKKINIFLVVMIMIVLAGMGGISIYYQNSLKQITDKHVDKSGKLDVCQAELQSTTQTLSNTIKNLNNTEKDIRKYDNIYSQITGELDETSDELSKTKLQLETAITYQKIFKQKVDDFQAENIKLKEEVEDLTQEVESQEKEIKKLIKEVNCLYDESDANEEAEC